MCVCVREREREKVCDTYRECVRERGGADPCQSRPASQQTPLSPRAGSPQPATHPHVMTN